MLESTGDKCEIERAWKEVREVRNETWEKEMPRISRKIEHLTKKAGRCETHRKCKELDAIYNKRMKEMRVKNEEEKTRILSGQPVNMTEMNDRQRLMNQDDTEETVKEKERNPGRLLSSKYHSRPEDLNRLQKEQTEILRMSQSFNKNWKEKKDTLEDEEEDEVMTFGQVELSQMERDLLNLGPGYMVVSELSSQEMQI